MLKEKLLLSFLCFLFLPDTLLACTRALYSSNDGKYTVTGRTMDWFENVHSNLWAFPRGIARNGATKKNPLKWESQYGSVIVAGFDVGTTDGMNEKGLVVNLLYLGETDFGKRDLKRPGLSWSIYSQYILDNFATVSETVEALKEDKIQVVASPLPGSSSKPPTVHFSLSDPSGDSAVFEYIKGKLVIHHGKQYKVMTNSPTYDQQLALNTYWQSISGDSMLPGTRRAADRFVRASYYIDHLPIAKSNRDAMAYVNSIMRNVSVPFGKSDPRKPNIAPTLWLTISDQKNKIYYYESTLSPGGVWVNLDQIDFNKGTPVKKLTLDNRPDLTGDLTKSFQPAKAFTFAGK